MKPARYLSALFLAMVLPLHAQIVTGQPPSLARRFSPTFSLKLDWNESGGLDGTIFRADPITGVVFGTITGAGDVQSRLVSIRFPGHGNFRGRMSKDGSVITGRLLFREGPSSRTLVRRFKLYAFAPTSTSGVTVTGTSTTGLTMTMTMLLNDAAFFPPPTVTDAVIAVEPVTP